MALTSLRVHGYRSVRDLTLPLGQVTVVTGANGTGKSNLYQALTMVANAAQGRFAHAIAEEGGMESVRWAGGERLRYVRKKLPVRVGVAIESDQFTYEFAAGIPTPNSLPLGTLFTRDPEVKEEKLTLRHNGKRVEMLKRDGPSAWIRNAAGAMDEYAFKLTRYESVLSQLMEPHRYPEVFQTRQALLGWRFYHQFRTDADSPLRYPQVGVQTPVLSANGIDLAAALETILEIGDEEALQATVAQAFSGARLQIVEDRMLFSVQLQMPGLVRPLDTREFSDGQLRFLCLCAALLSPRAPELIALNEPETSLHPDLYEPLAQLIARTARHSQIWVTTHARALADAIARHAGSVPLELRSVEGETRLASEVNSPRRPHQRLVFAEEEQEE